MISIKKLTRFSLFFLASWLSIIITALVVTYAGVDYYSDILWLTVVPACLAATDAGSQYYEDCERLPDSRFSWLASFQMTLVEIAISFPVILALHYAVIAENEGEVMLGRLILATMAAFAVPYAISFVGKRFAFSIAAESKRKEVRRKNDKIYITE